MPQLGETVTEGTITKWYKAVGDQVARDEPLFEVSTDKVDSEVPSPADGVLTEILVQEGDTVDVGVKLAVIGGEASPNGDAPRLPRRRRIRGNRRLHPPPGPTGAGLWGRAPPPPALVRRARAPAAAPLGGAGRTGAVAGGEATPERARDRPVHGAAGPGWVAVSPVPTSRP